MAGHAQLKIIMTECSKTQIRLTGLICRVFVQNIYMHPFMLFLHIYLLHKGKADVYVDDICKSVVTDT